MSNVQPPIIAWNHGDLLVFEDERTAGRYLEPDDVLAGEYECFDASGLRLGAQVDGQIVYLIPTNILDPERLVGYLQEFLRAVGWSEAQLAYAPLAQLVSWAQRYPTR